MGEVTKYPIVLSQTFIEATRDTGYRSTAAAVAELVDNAIQAKAKKIRIFVHEHANGGADVAVLDDGTGMDTQTLRRALQFGGSMRFGDRNGLGRFGMGLPNASVSQARRVDVFSWRAPNSCITSHLDVDEIASGRLDEVPTVGRGTFPAWAQGWRSFSGTLVVWSKCDRLNNRRLSTITKKLHEPLGRMFRHFLWRGTKIWVNDDPVSPVDPLFLHPSSPMSGASQFGDDITFEVGVPGKPGKTSMIKARFSELPVSKWHDLPVDTKRQHGIVDAAGMSVLRAGREVDYGWWFFGAKRRENYDSWWRGELSFEPELDELFAITHSKQGINPTSELREILTPDMEAIARQLNARVQAAFAAVKESMPSTVRVEPTHAEHAAPTKANVSKEPKRNGKTTAKRAAPAKLAIETYTVSIKKMKHREFFDVRRTGGEWVLVLNSEHEFYRLVYAPLRGNIGKAMRRNLERMLIAHAKSEMDGARNGSLRGSWTDNLSKLLEGPS